MTILSTYPSLYLDLVRGTDCPPEMKQSKQKRRRTALQKNDEDKRSTVCKVREQRLPVASQRGKLRRTFRSKPRGMPDPRSRVRCQKGLTAIRFVIQSRSQNELVVHTVDRNSFRIAECE